MNRILDLQRLEAVVPELPGNDTSTSSEQGCICSTNSFSGCRANASFVAI